jgi:rubrerythrin
VPELTGKSLYEIFGLAIESEREAQEMYVLGARLAGEETEIGRMFLALAADEREHERSLMREYGVFKRKLEESVGAQGPGSRGGG